MPTITYILNLFFITSLSIFWSSISGFRTLFLFLRNPSGFLAVKERKAPAQFTSPDWTHKRIKLSEVSLHYVEAGNPNAPLMLFVHGFPEFWYSWRSQIRHFARDYHVVAVDMRGYGDSDKPSGVSNYAIDKLYGDVKELIPALGYKDCVLVAHDWGGVICWQFVIRYPELVRRFIVCNCPHPAPYWKAFRSGKQFLKSWYLFLFNTPYLPEIIIRSFDLTMLEAMMRKAPMGVRNPAAFTDEDLEAWKYTFQQPGHLTGPINYYRAMLRRDPGLDAPLMAGELGLVRPPTLIIWGTGDMAIETSTGEESVAYCEDGTIRFINGASHWVQNDEPELVNQYMEAFLKA